MFFHAFFDLTAVFILGTFSITCIWLLLYYCGFLMPDWLAGIFAWGITWASHRKRQTLACVALGGSMIVDISIWPSTWFWTLGIGGVAVVCLWLSSDT